MNRNKKIFVTRSSLPPINEYVAEISPMWDNHWLTNMGEKHNQFQRQLKEYLKVPNIELLVNGHMAIELTLQAMDLKGEVITTPFTFASTTHAIVRNGLTPVFCDVNPYNYTLDTERIEDLITERTCAILPVHVYGNICDVVEIDRIARKHNLKVVYDAAHAFGEIYKGKGIGSFGDASCFSFHATKVFHSIEGGAVSFSDVKLGEALYELKNFGIRGPENVVSVGANAKLNEFCAAMGICNLRHIDEEIQKRRRVVERYRENLEGISGLQLNNIQEDVVSNFAYFPVLFDKKKFGKCRDEVFEELAQSGIFVRKYFYPLSNDFICYKGKYVKGNTPIATNISNQVLTLPLYADLENEDIDRICHLIVQKVV